LHERCQRFAEPPSSRCAAEFIGVQSSTHLAATHRKMNFGAIAAVKLCRRKGGLSIFCSSQFAYKFEIETIM